MIRVLHHFPHINHNQNALFQYLESEARTDRLAKCQVLPLTILPLIQQQLWFTLTQPSQSILIVFNRTGHSFCTHISSASIILNYITHVDWQIQLVETDLELRSWLFTSIQVPWKGQGCAGAGRVASCKRAMSGNWRVWQNKEHGFIPFVA